MFDAVLFLSYGGPESPEEVDPFLDRILSGKRVPAARRDAVRERYLQFDGLSPLPRECRRFLSAFKSMFQESDEKIGVYSGNLYTPPFVADVLEQLERDEVKSVLVFKSSAFVCRHYVDALLNALASRSSEFAKRLVVRFVPPFFETRAFQESVADSIRTALVETPASNSEATRLVLFTAHSIPVADSDAIQYRRRRKRNEVRRHRTKRRPVQLHLWRQDGAIRQRKRNARPRACPRLAQPSPELGKQLQGAKRKTATGT